MNYAKNLILVGVIKSSHGIQGHVIIKSFTDPAINITTKHLVNKFQEDINIKLININSKGDLICKLDGITTRTDAENLKGYKLFCLRSDLPNLEEDEFYICDLINMPVVNQELTPIGKVKNILNFGAGDIIEIILHNNKIELLPFNKKIFPTITKKYIVTLGCHSPDP